MVGVVCRPASDMSSHRLPLKHSVFLKFLMDKTFEDCAQGRWIGPEVETVRRFVTACRGTAGIEEV
jgi:hypothetical protein